MSTETTNHELDLDAIDARAGAATGGPWRPLVGRVKGMDGVHETVLADGPADDFDVVAMTGRMDEHPRRAADAAFIAAARTDVPALTAEVRRLRKVLDEIARMCECRNGGMCPSAIAHYALDGPDTNDAD